MFGSAPTSTHAAAPTPQYVLELNQNDILLGRGAPSNDNEGNKRFRAIIQKMKSQYVKTSKRTAKDSIARQVMDEIASRNGRFLRRVDSLIEAERLGVPSGRTAWVVVDEEVALLKVKQALRDREFQTADTSASSQPTLVNTNGDRKRPFRPEESEEMVESRQRNRLTDDATPNLANGLVRRQQAVGTESRGQVQTSSLDSLSPSQIPSQGPSQQALSNVAVMPDRINQSHEPVIGNPALWRMLLAGFTTETSSHLQDSLSLQPDRGNGLLFPNDVSNAHGLSSLSGIDNNFLAQRLALALVGAAPPVAAPKAEAVSNKISASQTLVVAANRASASVGEGQRMVNCSLTESLSLAILSVHGIPLLSETTSHSEPFHVSPGQTGQGSPYGYTWVDFSDHLLHALVDMDSKFRFGTLRNAGTLNSEQAQHMRQAGIWNPTELARSTIMLLEKLRQTGEGAQSSRIIPGGDVRQILLQMQREDALHTWYELELIRWSSALGLSTGNDRRPMAISAENLLLSSVSTRLDAEACYVVSFQISCLTRLRSMYTLPIIGLREKIERELDSFCQSEPRTLAIPISNGRLLSTVLQILLQEGHTASLQTNTLAGALGQIGFSVANLEDTISVVVPWLNRQVQTWQ